MCHCGWRVWGSLGSPKHVPCSLAVTVTQGAGQIELEALITRENQLQFFQVWGTPGRAPLRAFCPVPTDETRPQCWVA